MPYAMLHFTGSKVHNIKMRAIAKEKGWLLNQHGLFDKDSNLIKCSTEKEIFDKLEIDYIEPEFR
jgi:DNA polymerase (family 10)